MPKKIGRPVEVSYHPLYAKWSKIMLSEAGLTVEKLAEAFGVSISRFKRWMREHDDLRKAVYEGRAAFDTNLVHAALLKRALGYQYEETTEEVTDKGHKSVVVTKELPPDVGAIKHWLNNRAPDKWADKQTVEIKETGLAEALAAARKRIEEDDHGEGEQEGEPSRAQ